MPGSTAIKIAPSILSADYASLGAAVEEATRAGADYIHVDVVDGSFVPPITIGARMVAALRRHTSLPLDVHLMVERPERQVEAFARAGASIITVHAEATIHLHRLVQEIQALGCRAGVSICPATPAAAIAEVLPLVDLVLVMTVNPGFAGQDFIPQMCPKIARLRAELDRQGLEAELEVDGGINPHNAASVVQAGARVLVAGSAIFGADKPVSQALAELRSSCYH